MKIILDGNQDSMSCEDSDNLAVILDEITDYLTDWGKVIKVISLDDEPLDLNNIPDVSVANYQCLEIITDIGDDMPSKMMVEIQDSLSRLKQVMMDTANKIQQGEIEEAMTLFAAVCDGWDTIHRAIEAMAKFKDFSLETIIIEGEDGISILSYPADFMREMQEAMESKDYITVADILEFEIAPLFPRFEKLLAEISTRV